MHPQTAVSLRRHSTMRLGGDAAYLLDITSRQELRDAVTWAGAKKLPVIMIGSGSNIVWRDEGFPGLVLVNKLRGFEIIPIDEQASSVTIGAGENWDETVARTVAAGLTGIEALSLIPGTAGATPIQNVGAYGQEIADTLVSVEAYDTRTHIFVTIPAADCSFGYRTSRFKTADRGRFFITAITLELARGNPKPPFYASVGRYFDDHHVTSITPIAVRSAVIDIRSHKLPDPATVANNGSFFSNPVVPQTAYEAIVATHPDVPHWDVDNEHVKLSAAWLIEQAGFKDMHDPETGMATWPNQPLVLINEHAHGTADLIAFRDKLLAAVQKQFGVTLIQEPELLP